MLKKYSKISFSIILLLGFIGIGLFLSFIFPKVDPLILKKIIKISRLPNVIMIILGSAGGVISTFAIHLITKNNVADTGTIGISTLNMTIFTIVYISVDTHIFYTLRDSIMPLFYFGGSIIMLAIIYILTFKYKKSANKILLIGIVFSLTVGALNSSLFTSLNASRQLFLRSYKAGSIVSDIKVTQKISTIISYIFIGLSSIFLILFRKPIKIYYIDPIKAKALGVKINFIRFLLFTITGMGAAVLFNSFGELGFIGFISTNIIYLFIKKVSVC